MCGIAGIISSKHGIENLKSMLLVQSHRGPDHTGFYEDKGFALLGHNRLSIIDLSPEANEPFTDNSGRYYLTFNGEIYNYLELRRELTADYRFNTVSDTEVLMAAFVKWGRNCLDKLNGMFSFAIWDNQEKRLFAARDRFGVKPFYYHKSSDSLAFSSEIKALRTMTSMTGPNLKVWARYFTYGLYGMPDETFYKDIYQLPAGHYLDYKNGKLNIQKWYDFKKGVEKIESGYTFDESREIYFNLLKDSISLRFRADVPLAFNISGGVDSSLLLALVNLFEDRKFIQAYTFYTGNHKYDELEWVEKLISTTNNPLRKIKTSPEEIESLFEFISVKQDEPFGGIPTLAYSKIFKAARENGIKVLLDGQGMDEQWAGYDYYLNNESSERNIQGTGNKSPYKDKVMSRDFKSLATKPEYPEPFKNKLQNLQYRDLFFTKIPRTLRFNDRISMAYSTELREPFLDYRLVEFAVAQPEDYKIRNRVQKYMLREILSPLVPTEISYTPKRPLQTPQREWLANELKGFVFEKLKDLKKSAYADLFNHKEINKEWKNYLNGDRSSSFHIWQWISASTFLN